MFKLLSVVTVIVVLGFLLASTPVMAQSKEEGIKIFNEAEALRQKAQSGDDMRKAVEKYEHALRIFEAVKFDEGVGGAANNLGIVYNAWGQYDKAVEYHEKSLAIKRELKDRKGEGRTLTNLGNVYTASGKYDRAVDCYEKSLAICRDLKHLEGEAAALNCLGTVYSDWGQYDKAVEFCEKSLTLFRELKDPRGEGQTLTNLGMVFYHWGQYDKAVEFCEKSLTLFRELKDLQTEGLILMNLGVVYSDWGQYAKAAEYIEKSLIIKREFKDRMPEANSLTNLGLIYKNWGEYNKAVEYYEKSLAICRELKNPRGEGQTLANLGNVYSDRGQYEKAVENYEKSLAIFRELKDPRGEGGALHNLGLIYNDWGQYDKAVENYEKSLTIFRKLKDRKSEATSLMNIGIVLQRRGEHNRALEQFRRGFLIYYEIKVPTYWPKGLIADTYMDMGDLTSAETLLKEAESNPLWGRFYLLKSDYSKAKEYYEKILKSAEENRNVDKLFTACTGLGVAYEGMGDDKKAEEYFQKAVNLTEDLRSSLPKAQRETFFDVRINGFLRTAPYDGLARVRVRMNRPVEAFKVSEEIKARVFAEAMSKWSESTSFDIPADVLTKDRELNDQLAALKKKRQEGYEKASQEIISVIEPQVKELEGKLQAHIKMLREKYPLFAATNYPEPMELAETSLKESEWLLAYHVTDPGIIIYLTKGKEIVKALFKPIARDDLHKLVLTFRKPLEISSPDEMEEKLKSFDLKAGKELSELLLSDILENLPPRVPLLIVPDDSLGTLPFEMLVLNDKGVIKPDRPYISGAEFFGARNLITYCQSVTALTLSRIHAKAKAVQPGLLAITDPIFHEKDLKERKASVPQTEPPSGALVTLFKWLNLMTGDKDALMGWGGKKFPQFQRLEKGRQLAHDLKDMYKGPFKICTDLEASKDNFLKNINPSLNQYDKVVFATHGYFGKDLPGIMEPVLVLTLVPPGIDGYLKMTEVMGLNMNADIVALTACQTGLGKRTAGEGTMNMGRAFQYAGAKSVLMSLWNVSESTSVNLVKSFFRNMKEGKSKSEALASARQEIRKKKHFDHPFFWAAFILVGETD